jgi:hypothetical protein
MDSVVRLAVGSEDRLVVDPVEKPAAGKRRDSAVQGRRIAALERRAVVLAKDPLKCLPSKVS